MSRTSVRRGHVLAIPADEQSFAAAQVVDFYLREACFIAVFEPLHTKKLEFNLELALRAPVALVALTFDAKIVNGDWPILGEANLSKDVPLPAYKVEYDRGMRIEDHSGKLSRTVRATDPDLPFRTVVAPILLERAVSATHGRAPWEARFDVLKAPRPEARDDVLFNETVKA